MHELVETMQNLPIYAAYACAAGVGVCTIGAGAYWIAKKLAQSARQVAAVSLVGALLIGGMVVVGTDDAGTKPGTNDVTQVECGTNTTQQTEGDTNTVTQTGGDLSGTNGTGGVSGPLMLGLLGRSNLAQGVPMVVTSVDVAQMWRVGVTSDVSVFAEPTANAVTNADWCDYGGIQMESVKWRM